MVLNDFYLLKKKFTLYPRRADFGTCSLSKLFDTQVARRGRQVPCNPNVYYLMCCRREGMKWWKPTTLADEG